MNTSVSPVSITLDLGFVMYGNKIFLLWLSGISILVASDQGMFWQHTMLI